MSKRSRTPSPTEANKKLKSKSKSKSSRTCAVCLGSIEKEGWQACPRNGRHGMCVGCASQVKSKAKEGHRKHACPTCRASLTASKSSSKSSPPPDTYLPGEVVESLWRYGIERIASIAAPGYQNTAEHERELARDHVRQQLRLDPDRLYREFVLLNNRLAQQDTAAGYHPDYIRDRQSERRTAYYRAFLSRSRSA